MHVSADSPSDVVRLEITGPAGAPLEGRASGKASWRGRLPATQDYFVNVTSPQEDTDFQLSVIIYSRIAFDAEESSMMLSGHLGAHEIDHFVLWAQKGQTMSVVAEAPDLVGLTIWGADGIPLKRYVDEEVAWRGELPDTQDYFIEVRSIEATSYTLSVSIPPPPSEVASLEPASIVVISPNGGEEWLEGSAYTIAWTSFGIGKVDVAIASGGKPLEHIALRADAASGAFAWEIPVGLVSSFAVAESDSMSLRISSSDDPAQYDQSDQLFTVRCPRIQFASGADSARLVGTLAMGGDQFRYVLRASSAQTMTLDVAPAQVQIDIWGAQDGSTWRIPAGESGLTIPSLPATQDYFVTLTTQPGTEALDYTLQIVIR
jgi:hypothetical protein